MIVRENIQFTRGGDPKTAMFGLSEETREELENKIKKINRYKWKNPNSSQSNPDFQIDNIKPSKNHVRVEFRYLLLTGDRDVDEYASISYDSVIIRCMEHEVPIIVDRIKETFEEDLGWNF